ncbi:hypothetical protein [Roseofilum sp. Belize Diploria]|uniref:hypothetical protein n=1 Tax=Roseofilum sp. Belize Diploria TaxID=2821501 RepID=UPI001B27EED0|nr:hypothetical protein [Roseofilum sp. Belize Diploria]MBP0010206.1 hypothetical protein [Roseofilum sp. Belize Diploria]
MKIPEDAIIPDPKLTQYLLILKQRNDKSKYLAQGGFYLENWQDLKTALQKFIKANEAKEDTALCAVMRDSFESSKLCTKSLFPIPYSLAQSAILPMNTVHIIKRSANLKE